MPSSAPVLADLASLAASYDTGVSINDVKRRTYKTTDIPVVRYGVAMDNPSDRSHNVPVPISCPQCERPESHVVYRHVDLIAMFCFECEHSWMTDLEAYPFLRNVVPPLTEN